MIINRTPYPLSFAKERGQTLVARYGEVGRQYVMQPDVDVSGLVASLQIVKPDNTFVIASADIVEPEEGPAYIVCTIPLQATAVKGIGHYSLYIQDDADMIIYSAEGQIWVDDHLITDEMLESIAEVYGLRFPQDFLTVNNLVDIVAYVSANMINDETTAEDTTWSSQKIDEEISHIEPEPITATEHGNPIEITDAAAAPLVKCVTEIQGYQSGTGTPSPDNIRPIVAYTEGEIEVSDGVNTTTHTTTFPSAIYRGREDVVNGTETHDMVVDDLGSYTWYKETWGTGVDFYITALQLIIKSPTNVDTSANLLCTNYVNVSRNVIYNITTPCISVLPGGVLKIRDSRYDEYTVEDFKAAMSGVMIAYELATPTTSSVTPTNLPIRTLSGYNHIESSTGEMEVEYITEYYEPLAEIIERGDTHNYSTAEQVVGKWIDGKDLYEITLDITSPASINTNATIESLASLSFDKIVSLEGLIYASGVSQYVPIFWSYNTSIMGAVYIDGTNLKQIVSSAAYCNCREWITIRYTKTS